MEIKKGRKLWKKLNTLAMNVARLFLLNAMGILLDGLMCVVEKQKRDDIQTEIIVGNVRIKRRLGKRWLAGLAAASVKAKVSMGSLKGRVGNPARQLGLEKGKDMARYRKKPIIIEAWYWQGKTLLQAKSFCMARGLPEFVMGSRGGQAGLIIPTLEGEMIARQGDWIIKGVKGEFYPCKPDVFKQTYEKVE